MSSSPNLPAADHVEPPRLRALVIDDDPLFRTLLVSMLKRDYVVSVAVDGKDGFYKAIENPPDVAVVDIQMPVWDGLRTLRAFREHDSLRHVGLLVLTSDASRETLLAAIHGGADDYIMKSTLSRRDLLEKLFRTQEFRRPTVAPNLLMAAAAVTAAEDEVDGAPSGDGMFSKRLQAVLDSWE